MLDAGDRSCAMEATSHGSALQRLDGVRFAVARLHEPEPGPPRLPRDMEGYFEAKRRLFVAGRPPAAVNVGDAYGRRLADELRRGHAARRSASPRRRDRPTLDSAPPTLHGRRASTCDAAPRPLQRRERRSPPSRRRACSGSTDDAIAARRRVRAPAFPGRFEPVDEGQPFTVLVDYAHKPDALENVLRAARELTAGPRDLRLRLRRRPRPRQAPADGRGSRPSSPTSRSSPPTTRAARIRRRSSTRCSPATAGELEVELDRRARRSSARSSWPRAGRRRRDRGQGPRAGTGVRRPGSPFDDRRGRAARRCGR